MMPPRLPDAVEHVPLARLIPYARNARTHDEDQVAKIAASIVEFGWLNPVLIDDAGHVIAGHGRLLAAQKLGLDAVPVIRASHLTPAQVVPATGWKQFGSISSRRQSSASVKGSGS